MRRVSSRALRAASRAVAASTTLPMISLLSTGWVSSHRARPSAITLETTGVTSELTSLSLVCEENLGSGILTESTQVRPSRMSSPVSVTLSRLRVPLSSANLLSARVRAARKPMRWVPPSRCGMLLVKLSMVSW